MAIIKKLAPEVAAKIAAGEVVEKPYNVVKEMIENCCDAEATKIVVEIDEGGLTRIKIVDNGKGIEKDDLPLALERFATSKAESVEDVYSAKTFGFRGEALAAISSVSNFTIRSGRDGEAYEINSNFGEIGEIKPAAAINGTSIEVLRLFDNLPARRKFLKSSKSLETEISKLIKHFSLVNPNVDITLVVDGKVQFHAGLDDDLTTRCSKVFIGKVFNVGESEDGNTKVIASCTVPSSSDRLKRDAIILGVNGRLIKDPTLVQAVIASYFRLIPAGRFPCAVVNIIIDPNSVDANVHPAKLEVRFEKPIDVFHLVQNACQNSFKGKGVSMEYTLGDETSHYDSNNYNVNNVNNLSNQNSDNNIYSNLNFNNINESNLESGNYTKSKYQYGVNENINDTYISKDNLKSHSEISKANIDENSKFKPVNYEKNDFSESYKEGEENYFSDYGEQINNNDDDSIIKDYPDKIDNPNFAFSFDDVLDKQNYTVENKKDVYDSIEDRIANGQFRVVGQIDKTYILIETENREILFIDQHVAHERILFEKINYLNETKDKPSVVLHEPIVVKLTDEILDEIDDYKLLIENFGYGYEKEDNESVKITRIPYSSIRRNIEKEFKLIVADLCVEGSSKTEDAPRAMLSCKSAIKAGDPLTVDEMEYLVKLLFQTNNFGTCPHGRPIIYAMTVNELGRKFLR